MAKQIYNKERREKVLQHKEEMQVTGQMAVEQRVKKEKKTDKKRDEELRKRAREHQARCQMEEAQRQAVQARIRTEKQHFEMTLKERYADLVAKD
mmetsp:Transcript_14434/g.24625  ORF Transcript_14434/g.24625 Transcript_14434/m.24625 type:complete len:95 (+) Transcript_14434:485-769(+)